MMYQCANCEGSGYFDLPDDTEQVCSVCGGAGEVDYDAAIARAEAAEARAEAAENEKLQEWRNAQGALDDIGAPGKALSTEERIWLLVGWRREEAQGIKQRLANAEAEVTRLQAELAQTNGTEPQGLPPQCPRCEQHHTWKHLD